MFIQINFDGINAGLNYFSVDLNKLLRYFIYLYSLTLFIYVLFSAPQYLYGDADEYLGMTISFYNHLSPDLREDDIILKKEIIEKNNLIFDPSENFTFGYYVALNNKRYSYHFWLYSLLNLPLFSILHCFKLNEVKCYQIFNSLILIICLSSILHYKNITDMQKMWLLSLSAINPIVFYVRWQHPEVFCYSLLILSVASILNNNFRIAILASSIASMQSSPILIFITWIIFYGFYSYKKSYNMLYNLTIVSTISTIPLIFYYVYFKSLSLFTNTGFADVDFITLSKIFSLFIDLNFGILIYSSILFVISLIMILISIAKRDLFTASLLIILFVMATLYSTQYNWNSGMMYINRYSTLLCPILVLVIGYNIPKYKLLNSKKIFILLSIISMLIILPQLYEYDLYNDKKFNDISTYVIVNTPSLYNPPPDVFATRATGQEMLLESPMPAQFLEYYYNPTTNEEKDFHGYLPIIYRYNGVTRKILVDNNSFDYMRQFSNLSDELKLSDDMAIDGMSYVNYRNMIPTIIDESKIEIYTNKSLLYFNARTLNLSIVSIIDAHGNKIEYWDGTPTLWISNRAILAFYSEVDNEAVLNFRIASFNGPRTLQIYDSQEILLYETTISDSFVNINKSIPINKGFNRIKFNIPEGCQRPSDVTKLRNPDYRCLSCVIQDSNISNNILTLDQESLLIYLGDHWYTLEKWDGITTYWLENNGTILIESNESGLADMSFQALAFHHPRTLIIYVNDIMQTQTDIDNGGFTMVSVPAISLNKGFNRARFYITDGCERPCDISELNYGDSRCLSIAVQDIKINKRKAIIEDFY